MTNQTPIAVIHENEAVLQWVASLNPDWDAQFPITDADSVWTHIENKALDPGTSIFFISDLLFQKNPDSFCVAIAGLAQSALVIIIQEDPSLQEAINAAVEKTVIQYRLLQGPYYFFNIRTEDSAGEVRNIENSYREFMTNNTLINLAEQQEALARQVSVPAQAPGITTQAPAAQPEVLPASFGVSAAAVDETVEYENTLKRPGVIVASTSSKGGSGKTTAGICTAITISLGSRLAAEHGLEPEALKVAVIDLDVRDGQIGFLINQTSPNIMNVVLDLHGAPPVKEVIKKHMINLQERYGIDILLAPKQGRVAEYLTPEFYNEVIKEMQKLYDLVIVDTSVNYLDPLLREAVFPLVDGIMFITTLVKGSVFAMPRWMNEVTGGYGGDGSQAVPIPIEKIGVVINQSLGEVGIDLGQVKKAALGAELLVAIPADDYAVVRHTNEGTLYNLIRKHPTIGPNYFKLARRIWQSTQLLSPHEAYLASDEYQRDQALAASGKVDRSDAVANMKPLSQAPPAAAAATGKKKLFGKR